MPAPYIGSAIALLCQSGRQGANHFRLSDKSSNIEKLSAFSPHKVVIAEGRGAQKSEWRTVNCEQKLNASVS